MAHLISFQTARFDVSQETPNETNPIAGQSVLRWLRDELTKAHYQVTEPDTEDWGWYIDVAGPGASYLVGASADATDVTPPIEWIVQVHKKRSLKEKILGRNTMAADDPLSALIERLVRADSSIEKVDVTRGPEPLFAVNDETTSGTRRECGGSRGAARAGVRSRCGSARSRSSRERSAVIW